MPPLVARPGPAMQEYKRRQFRGDPLSLAGNSLRTEGFRGVLASRAQLGLEDQLRFENNVPTIPFETEIRDSRMSSITRQHSVLLGLGQFGRRHTVPWQPWSSPRLCG